MAVPGCTQTIPDDRSKLKECAKTKHQIILKEKNIGNSQAQAQEEAQDIEEL
jgi:hypothetical protein